MIDAVCSSPTFTQCKHTKARPSLIMIPYESLISVRVFASDTLLLLIEEL
jgi:hypothetical protein